MTFCDQEQLIENQPLVPNIMGDAIDMPRRWWC